MKNHSDATNNWDALRDKLIGLGECSIRKSYYPQLQERLAELERFKALLDESNDAIFLMEIPSGRFVDLNASACRQLDYSRQELLSMSIYDIIERSTSERINQFFSDTQVNPDVRETITTAFHKRNGDQIPEEITFSLVLFDHVLYAVAVARDVSERKRAEESLQKAYEELEIKVEERTAELSKSNAQLKREIEERKQAQKNLAKSESRYRSLVENINDVIFSTDRNGIITYISPAIESIIEYNPSEVIGHHFAEFIFQEDRESLKKQFQKIISGELVPYEYQVVTKSGKIRWVKSSSRAKLKENAIIGISGVLSDITLTKLLQDELIRSERLAATGQLAASIAHEINSPLQGIVALLSVIRKNHQEDEKLLNDLDLVMDAFGNIRNIVKNLLDLNRPGNEKKQLISVNTIIEKTIALLHHHLRKNKIRVNFSPSLILPKINASPQPLGQVFMNLINNAVEAIRSESDIGGEIIINTSLKEDDIIIKVADTGPGISEEALQHIFDPFYTRKKTMGLGVGLSICHGIIEDHKGTIVAENSPKGGAVFTITLPVNP